MTYGTFPPMETHEPTGAKTPFTDLFLRSIAVLGLIAVLLLGAWGIIQLAVAIPNFLGNIGSNASTLLTNTSAQNETITVSAPASVTSGQTVQLSWDHKNIDTSAQYSYTILYACQNGLTLKAPVPTGAYQNVPCNTPFNYVNATQHMIVVPTVSGNASVPVVFTITATKLSTGAITAQGSATVTVAIAAVATEEPASAAIQPITAATPNTGSTGSPQAAYYPAAPTQAALYGYPDLAVRIISITPNGTLTTVQFVIENDGTNIVNSGWTFNALLPINGSYTFASQPQQTLYPGDKIVYNLSFSNSFGSTQYQNGSYYTGPNGYNAGGYSCNGYNCTPPNQNYRYNYANPYRVGTITITADPFNYVAELNKGNNTITATTPVY
jgi:hypothetical protein